MKDLGLSYYQTRLRRACFYVRAWMKWFLPLLSVRLHPYFRAAVCVCVGGAGVRAFIEPGKLEGLGEMGHFSGGFGFQELLAKCTKKNLGPL